MKNWCASKTSELGPNSCPEHPHEDAHSLVYDSALMTENFEIVGIPRVTLQTTADAPAANWLVRLSDVAPNGMATHVTGAGFNANHVESSEHPIQLVKDKVYTLEIDLHATSWTFDKGHRIRLSVNNAQWPMIWPSPYNMTTTVRSDDDGRSFLELPAESQKTIKVGSKSLSQVEGVTFLRMENERAVLAATSGHHSFISEYSRATKETHL